MIESILFVLGSAFIIWYSIPSLRKPGSHGFYRFFAWEVMWGMFLINVRGRFVHPFAWYQIISWILLFGSILPVVAGFRTLRVTGKPEGNFEATTRLVTTGI